MTDRIDALTVVLDHNFRDDDVQEIVQAIRMVRGVLDVKPHVAEGMAEYTARVRIVSKLQKTMFEHLNAVLEGKD